MTVKEPSLHSEYTKASVSSEASRELHELSESGTEVIFDGFLLFVEATVNQMLNLFSELKLNLFSCFIGSQRW